MKLSFDSRFVGTTLLVSVVLAVVVAAVNWVAGAPAAALTGVLLGAIAVKLFDKLEFNPTEEIRFGAPLVSLPWIYSAAVAVFLLYGTRLFADILKSTGVSDASIVACSGTLIASALLVDWGGIALGGWLIGKVFPERALSLAALSTVVVFPQWWLTSRSIGDERAAALYACYFGHPATEADLVEFRAGMSSGVVIGLVLRAALALVLARLASRSALQKAAV